MIKNHGGLLTVSSEPGEGATFSIYIPAREKEGALLEVPAPSAQATTKIQAQANAPRQVASSTPIALDLHPEVVIEKAVASSNGDKVASSNGVLKKHAHSNSQA